MLQKTLILLHYDRIWHRNIVRLFSVRWNHRDPSGGRLYNQWNSVFQPVLKEVRL